MSREFMTRYHMPHWVDVSSNLRILPMSDWCEQNIGTEEVDWDWTGTWPAAWRFYFVREQDLTLFALRWLQ